MRFAACKYSSVIYKCCTYGIYWYNPDETDLNWITYTHITVVHH